MEVVPLVLDVLVSPFLYHCSICGEKRLPHTSSLYRLFFFQTRALLRCSSNNYPTPHTQVGSSVCTDSLTLLRIIEMHGFKTTTGCNGAYWSKIPLCHIIPIVAFYCVLLELLSWTRRVGSSISNLPLYVRLSEFLEVLNINMHPKPPQNS